MHTMSGLAAQPLIQPSDDIPAADGPPAVPRTTAVRGPIGHNASFYAGRRRRTAYERRWSLHYGRSPNSMHNFR